MNMNANEDGGLSSSSKNNSNVGRKRKTTASLYESDEEDELIKKPDCEIKNNTGNEEDNAHHITVTVQPTTNNVNALKSAMKISQGKLNEQLQVLEHSSTTKFLLSVFIARKGEREEMQDRHVLIDSFYNDIGNFLQLPSLGEKRFAFYALFDGHAGEKAADFCSQNFMQFFVDTSKKNLADKTTSEFERCIKKIFVETYKAIDDEFLNEARKFKPTLKDGTTASTIILLGQTIYCANVGDSKVVVCRYKQDIKESLALQLTIDHNPTSFEERMRIQKAGAIVKDGRVMGILELSRSIGDGQLKSHGVICTPDVRKLTLTEHDPFLILACDGLWKTFTPDSAVKYVIDRFKNKVFSTNASPNDEGLWTSIADEMCADAIRKGCGDNVSIVLVILLETNQLKKLLCSQ